VAIVVDASMTLAMLFEDERTPAVEMAWQRIAVDRGTVPAHFSVEVANGILTAVRRERFDTGAAAGMFNVLDDLSLEVGNGEPRAAFELAERHRLTVYDAAYLELAIRLRSPLASLDKQLVAAARLVGLEVFSD